MEDLGIIRRSSSQWASPLHIAPKPGGGWRPCGDFRRLNGRIKADCYPVPHIQDFASQLSGKTIFSKIDLIKGYHQIPVRAMDIPKTAVITPLALFEFLRTPFGLAKAAQAFQRLMDSVLQDLVCSFTWMTSSWPVPPPLSIFGTSLPFLIVLNDMASLFIQASVFLV